MQIQKPAAKVPSKLLVGLNNIYVMLWKEHRHEAEWMLAPCPPQNCMVNNIYFEKRLEIIQKITKQ